MTAEGTQILSMKVITIKPGALTSRNSWMCYSHHCKRLIVSLASYPSNS